MENIFSSQILNVIFSKLGNRLIIDCKKKIELGEARQEIETLSKAFDGNVNE